MALSERHLAQEYGRVCARLPARPISEHLDQRADGFRTTLCGETPATLPPYFQIGIGKLRPREFQRRRPGHQANTAGITSPCTSVSRRWRPLW
jgi:hypothetical protein